MGKKLIILILLLSLAGAALAVNSCTRFYVGDFDGQSMAGIDATLSLGYFFVGGDIRALIGETIEDSEQYSFVGFAPERTDYTFKAGLDFKYLVLEYASTCYHRVIAKTGTIEHTSADIIPNTQTFQIKLFF